MESAKKLFRKENLLPLLGPCMVTFAVPLMIPGFTLTLVALKDETGFSKFGALHVIGILLLIVSGLLIIAGCVLKCTLSVPPARVSPQDEEDGTVSWCVSPPGSGLIKGNVHSTHSPDASATRTQDGHGGGNTTSHWPDAASDYTKAVAAGELAPSSSPVHNEDGTTPSGNSSSNVPVVPRPVTAEAVAREMQSRSGESGKEAMHLQELSGTQRQKKLSSTRGAAGNYMDHDSDHEQEMTRKYVEVAQTFPKNEQGLIKGSSCSSSLTESSSSFSSGQSLLQSFDVEQDPPDCEDSDLQGEHVQTSVQVQRASKSRQGFVLDKGTVSSRERSTTSIESELSSPKRKGVVSESKEPQLVNTDTETIERGETQRLFVARAKPDESAFEDSRENARTQETSENASPKHLRPGLRDASSSSLEQHASSVESPSHGTYSVKSCVSEELWDLRESPMESHVGAGVGGDYLQSRGDYLQSRGDYLHSQGDDFQSHLFPVQQRSPADRPTSPIPLQSDTGLVSDTQVTVFGRSREAKAKSFSSMEGSPAKQSLPRNVSLDSRSEDLSGQNAETDDFHPESKRSKRRKKKKKKKKKKTAAETEHHGGIAEEAETSDMQHCGDGPLSPLKSIMHPHHHSDYHVHWPDR